MAAKKDIIKCKCGNEFTPHYDFRTGILKSKFCPACQYKKAYEKSGGNNSFFGGKKGKSKASSDKRKKSPKTLAMERADTWFSKWVRMVHSFEDGGELFCKDIITGHPYHIKNIDNGHCFSRDHKPTRYHPDNCRPQNRSSNRHRGEADHLKFETNLIAEIGQERFNNIEQLRRELGEDNEAFYKKMSDKYRILFHEEVRKKGLNPWRK
jgi:hypothetical protein